MGVEFLEGHVLGVFVGVDAGWVGAGEGFGAGLMQTAEDVLFFVMGTDDFFVEFAFDGSISIVFPVMVYFVFGLFFVF